MADEITYDVMNTSGKKVESVALKSIVFDAPAYDAAVHATVRWQRAKARQGTHSTLNRAKIQASNKKPFKQKGTGSARAGSTVSPLWRGGAVSHGPQPRSYEHKLPKGVRKNALRAVLSDKVRQNKLVIVDALEITGGKTKDMQAVLDALGVNQSKVLIVTKDKVESVMRSSRNLPKAKSLSVDGTNVYDVVNSEYLLTTKDGIDALLERLQ
ncbi:MAG: 50S ribosomal protein L4 [Bdellovibrionales bacterium]|nr:50S ribosomal protein L4 [Bdellovibrionales bacterium]